MIFIIAIIIGIPALAGVLDFKFGPDRYAGEVRDLEYERHMYLPQTYWYNR